MKTMNPTDARDLLLEERCPFVRACTVRALLSQGWTPGRILVEVPTLPESIVRAEAEAFGDVQGEVIPLHRRPAPNRFAN